MTKNKSAISCILLIILLSACGHDEKPNGEAVPLPLPAITEVSLPASPTPGTTNDISASPTPLPPPPRGSVVNIYYDDNAQTVYNHYIKQELFRVQAGWRMWLAEFSIFVPEGGRCVLLGQDTPQMRVAMIDTGGYERDAYVELYRNLNAGGPTLCPGMAMTGTVYGEIPANQEPESFTLESSEGPLFVDLTTKYKTEFPIEQSSEMAFANSLEIDTDRVYLRVAALLPTRTESGADQLNFHIELENRGGFNRTGESIIIHAFDNNGRYFNANIAPYFTIVPGSRLEWDHVVQRDEAGYYFQPGFGNITRELVQIYLQDEETQRYYLQGMFYYNFETTPVVDIPIPQQTAAALTAAAARGLPPISAANAAQAHQLAVYDFLAGDLAFSPDGAILAVAYGKIVRLLDPITGQVLHGLLHEQNVTDFVFSPDGRWLATVFNYDESIALWDTTTGERVLNVEKIGQPVFARSGAWFAFTARQGEGSNTTFTVRRFDLQTHREIEKLPDIIDYDSFSGTSIQLINAGPDDQTLMFTNGFGYLSWWDVGTQTERFSVDFGDGSAQVIYNADASRMILFNDDSDMAIYSLANEPQLVYADDGLFLGETVSASANGEFLAYVSQDSETNAFFVQIVSADNGEVVNRIGLANFPQSIALSPDGSILAEGRGYNGAASQGVNLWDVRSGQMIAAMDGDISAPQLLSFNPDGSLLTSFGSKVSVWGVAP